MSTWSSPRLRAVALVGVALLVLSLSWRLHQIHEATWEWRLWASNTPQKVRWAERDYGRGGEVTKPQAGAVEVGRVLNDVPVYSLPTKRGHDSTVIVLRTDGRWVTYGLMGGP